MLAAHSARSDPRAYFPFLALFESPSPKRLVQLGVVIELVQLLALIVNHVQPFGGILRAIALPTYFSILPFWDQHYPVSVPYQQFSAFVWVSLAILALIVVLSARLVYAILEQLEKQFLPLVKLLIGSVTTLLFQPILHFFLAYTVCTNGGSGVVSAFTDQACVHTASSLQIVLFVLSIGGMVVLCSLKFFFTVTVYDDLPSTGAPKGRSHNKCEVALLILEIVAAVLFHFQPVIGQRQAFAGIFAFGCILVAILHAFYLPFFHMAMNSIRCSFLFGISYVAAVVCIFYANDTAEAATATKNWNSLVLIGGFFVSSLVGYIVSRIRLSARCQRALAAAAVGRNSAPKEGAIFPEYLPVDEVIKHRDLEAIVLGEIKFPRAQESLTGPQREREELRDELWVAFPYIDAVFCESDVEVAVRHLREFMGVTALRLPPLMVAYALRVYSKGLARFTASSWLQLQFAAFLCSYCPSRNQVALSLCDHINRDTSVDTLLLFRTSRRASSIAVAMLIRDSTSKKSFLTAQQMHKDALLNMKLFWSKLLQEQVDVIQLGALAKVITDRREEGLRSYERVVTDTSDTSTLIKFAQFLEQVMMDPDAATSCRETVLDAMEQEQLGVVKDVNNRVSVKSHQTNSAANRSRTVENLNFNINLIFGMLFVIVIGLFVFGYFIGKNRTDQTNKLDVAGSARTSLEHLLFQTNMLADAVWNGFPTSQIAALLSTRLVAFRQYQNELTVGADSSTYSAVVGLFATAVGRLRYGGSHTRVGLWEAGQYLASSVETILDAETTSDISERSVAFLRDNAHHAASLYNESLTFYIQEAQSQLDGGVAAITVFYVVSLFVLVAVYTVLIYNFKLIGTSKLSTLSLFTLIPKNALDKLMQEGTQRIDKFDQPCDIFQQMKIQRGLEDDHDAMDQVMREVLEENDLIDSERRRSDTVKKSGNESNDDVIDAVTNKFASLARNSSVADTGKVKAVIHGQFEPPYAKDQFFAPVESVEALRDRKKELNDEMVEEDLRVLRSAGRTEVSGHEESSSHNSSHTNDNSKAARGSRESEETRRQYISVVGIFICIAFCVAYGGVAVQELTKRQTSKDLTEISAGQLTAVNSLQELVWHQHVLVGQLVASGMQEDYDNIIAAAQTDVVADLKNAIVLSGDLEVAGKVYDFDDAWYTINKLEMAVVSLMCSSAGLSCNAVGAYSWTSTLFVDSQDKSTDIFSPVSKTAPAGSDVELLASSNSQRLSALSIYSSAVYRGLSFKALQSLDAARDVIVNKTSEVVNSNDAENRNFVQIHIALGVGALAGIAVYLGSSFGRSFETPLTQLLGLAAVLMCLAMIAISAARGVDKNYLMLQQVHDTAFSLNSTIRGAYYIVDDAQMVVLAKDSVAAVRLDLDHGGDLFRNSWRQLSALCSVESSATVLSGCFQDLRTSIGLALIASALATEAYAMYQPPVLRSLTWNFTNDVTSSRLLLEFPHQTFYTSRSLDSQLPNVSKTALAVDLLFGSWMASTLSEGVALCQQAGNGQMDDLRMQSASDLKLDASLILAEIVLSFGIVGLMALKLFLLVQFVLDLISASRFGDTREDELFQKLTQRSRVVLIVLAACFSVLFAVTVADFGNSRRVSLQQNLASLREFDVVHTMVTAEEMINNSWQRASTEFYSDLLVDSASQSIFTANNEAGLSGSDRFHCAISTLTNLHVNTNSSVNATLIRGADLAQRRWKDELYALNSLAAPASIGIQVRRLEQDMMPLTSAISDSTSSFASSANTVATQGQAIFFAITAATTVVLVVLFFVVFRPMISLLLNEEEGTKVMLKMIPVEVRESVPAIAEYLETGVVLQDMKVQEINEAAGDLSTVPTITIDTKGVIVKFSRAAEDAFLWTKSEAVGSKVQILMPENIAAEHDSYLVAYRKTGVKKIIGNSRKIRAKRKDGTLFPAEITVQECRNGRNTTFVGTLRNISVEIEFERAIALSTAVSEAATVPIVVINIKGVILRFNSAAEETFKCSQADVVGRKVNVLMPQAEADMHDQFLDRYAKTGIKNVIDLRRRARAKKLTGELFPVSLNIRELKRGKESLFIGYVEDMTKQTHLQMASMVSEAIMATSPVPLIVIDEAGLVQSWSPAAVIAFGHSPQDVYQRNIKFLLPDNIAQRHDAYLQQYQKTKRKKMIDNVTLVKAKRREEDGSTTLIPVRIAVKDITEQGKPNRFVAFVQDVSSQQILEREYKISSSITNLSSTPLVTINEKGIVTAYSAAAEMCFGYTKAEIMDANVSMLCPPGIREQHDGYLQRYLSTGVKTVVDKNRRVPAFHKQGRTFLVEICVKEVKFGGQSHFVAHLRDVDSEAKMQEANAYNDAISHLTTTPIVVINMEGIVLSCSESTCERFAWSREELIGQNVSVLMPDHFAMKHDGFLQRYKQRLATQGADAARKVSTILHQERRVTGRTRDEQQFSAAVHVRDLHIDGMPPLFVGYIRDITDEIQLAVQKTIAESIIQLSSIPLICIDRIGTVHEFSLSAQKDFLYTREEVIGKNIKMLMPDEVAQKHDGYLRAYSKTGVKNVIDSKRQVQGRKKNGRFFPVEITVKEVLLKDTNGRDTSEYIGFVRDLTQQYILQQAQLINEVVMQLATVPIILINTRGIILDFNLAAAREFGYEQSEVVSHNIKMLMPDEVASHHDAYLQQYKATGKKTIIDSTRLVNAKRKGGVLFPCEVSVREVLKAGAETQYIGYVRNVTSKQQLATQHRVNSAIIGLSATPLVVIDSFGTISMTNEAAELTFGYKQEELKGHNIKMLMPAEIANVHDSYLERYRSTGVKTIIDSSRRLKAIKKNGVQFPAEVSVKEIKDNDGQSIFIGYIYNCTEEVQAKQQIDFGECVNSLSPVPIISIDHIGTIQRFSCAAEAEFGYRAEEIIGQNIKSLQTDEVASKHDMYLSRYLATGQKHVIGTTRRVVAKRADGTTFNSVITVREVRTQDNPLPSYVGYLRNIDVELKNQESFREGNAMMALSPVPVIVLSLHGIIVELNKATETTFGYTSEELVGKNVKMLMPPAVAANHDSYLQRYIQTRMKTVIDTIRHVSAVKKSGYQFQCEISVREIAIQGIETQYIGYVRDVTEALKMKEAATINEAVTSLSTSPLLVIDPEGIILKFSRAAETLFDYTEAEIVGENLKKLMPSNIAVKHDGFLERYKATRVKRVIDQTTNVSAKKKDGTTFPCEIGVREVKNNDGTTAVFIGFIRSLDEAVLKVGQSSEVNGMMIDLASQGMVIIDRVGLIERANDALAAIFNAPVGYNFVGNNIKSLMPDSVAAKHDGFLAKYTATGVKSVIGSKRELFGKDLTSGKALPL